MQRNSATEPSRTAGTIPRSVRRVLLRTSRAFVGIGLASACCMQLSSAQSAADATAPELTAADWREDLDFLDDRIRSLHPDPFATISEPDFAAAIADLHARLDHLERHSAVLGIARVVALLRDGHSSLLWGFDHSGIDPALHMRAHSLEYYDFDDGLFVRTAAPELAQVVGGRVLRLGDADARQALDAVAPLVSHDNAMRVRFIAPYLLAMPEVLHGLGLAPDLERIDLVVERDGREVAVRLRPVSTAQAGVGSTLDFALGDPDPRAGWVDMADGVEPPLYLREPERHFGWELLPDHRALYVQINRTRDTSSQTLEDFFGGVFELAETHAVERLVLDLRHNQGGNSFLNWPLIYALIRSDRLNRPGRLFALVGRRTFSAAQNLVNQLEHHTETVFVGEPTGSTPNFFGDSRVVVLPNSGISVRISSVYHQESPVGPFERRPWTAPAIAAPLSSSAFTAGLDPALAAALEHEPEPSLRELLESALGEGRHDALAAIVVDWHELPAHRYADMSEYLGWLGAELLEARPESALALFECTERFYPRHPGAVLGRGDALAGLGRGSEALRAYERALALDPHGTAGAQARARIAELKARVDERDGDSR